MDEWQALNWGLRKLVVEPVAARLLGKRSTRAKVQKFAQSSLAGAGGCHSSLSMKSEINTSINDTLNTIIPNPTKVLPKVRMLS